MSATFLVVAVGEAGHVLPALSIVEGLAHRGHRVLVFTEERFKHGAVAAGGEPVAPSRYKGFFSELLPSSGASRERPRNPVAALRMFRKFRALLVESASSLAGDLEDIIRREKVACLVACFIGLGARYAAERTDCLFASVTPNPLMVLDERGRMMLPPRPWVRYLPAWVGRAFFDRVIPIREVRRQLGLPPRKSALPEFLESCFSEQLHLVMAHRSFFPDKAMYPGHVCVGPMSFNLPRADAKPFSVESVKPGTVMVSTSTISLIDGGLFRRTLEALAPLGVPILATAAGAQDIPAGLGEHVRIESFVPHDEVLPHVSALVTHGGWGITGRALRHGVPMLITPIAGDQPLIAERLAKEGLAYRLSKDASPTAIREALTALLADRPLRQRLKATAAELRALDTPRLAAEALEKFVASRGRSS